MKNTECIIHCRVSSAKQAQQGESLSVQEQFCRGIAERNGWRLAHEPWLEAFSGRKRSRPIFAEILAFLDTHPGRVRFYVCRSIDRFTRGGSFAYEAMKRELSVRGVSLVDTNGVIQGSQNTLDDVGFEYEWSRYSPSEITETVLANTAKSEVNSILTRMIGQEIRLTQKGYKIRGPQDGYQNQKIYVDGKRRTIQVPDRDRAPFYTMMFELRAAGQLSDAEIVARVNALGYRSREHNRWDATHTRIVGKGGGRPLSVKQLQTIIKRPIYCGIVWEKWTNWEPVRAAYNGLVSIETYNAANHGNRYLRSAGDRLELLHNFDPSKVGSLISRTNPLYPYKSVILCHECRKPFMASASRSRNGNRIPAYHCARNHPRVALNKTKFEQAVDRYVNRLMFSPNAADLISEIVLQKYEEHLAGGEDRAKVRKAVVTELEERQRTIARAFADATSQAVRRTLEEDVENLEAQITDARQLEDETELTHSDVRRYTDTAEEVLEHPAKLLESPENRPQQRRLFELVFDGLPTLREITSGTAKLSPIIYAARASADDEALLVRLSRLTWNQIEAEIRKFISYDR